MVRSLLAIAWYRCTPAGWGDVGDFIQSQERIFSGQHASVVRCGIVLTPEHRVPWVIVWKVQCDMDTCAKYEWPVCNYNVQVRELHRNGVERLSSFAWIWNTQRSSDRLCCGLMFETVFQCFGKVLEGRLNLKINWWSVRMSEGCNQVVAFGFALNCQIFNQRN